MRVTFLCIICALASIPVPNAQPAVPLVDHHQHLYSSETVAFLPPFVLQVSAEDVVRRLDETGIRRAVVLSQAYQVGNPNRAPVEGDEYAKVRAENDWTSTEVARFPDRLLGFCSVNPLKDYAIEEVTRCARDPNLRKGVKLHFGTARVDLEDPLHLARVRALFATANANRMAIVVHIRPSRRELPYAAHARLFVDSLLPEAGDVPVQIAHLAGNGGYDEQHDEALRVFIDAIARNDERTARLFFDASAVVGVGSWAEHTPLIATRIRELGVQRVLFGTDGHADPLESQRSWSAFRQLPLSEDEFAAIAANVAPYAR